MHFCFQVHDKKTPDANFCNIELIYHDIRSQNIMAWKIMLNIIYMKFIPASGLPPSLVNNISILKVFKVYHCLNIITWIILICCFITKQHLDPSAMTEQIPESSSQMRTAHPVTGLSLPIPHWASCWIVGFRTHKTKTITDRKDWLRPERVIFCFT